jgi:hypothetical protein
VPELIEGMGGAVTDVVGAAVIEGAAVALTSVLGVVEGEAGVLAVGAVADDVGAELIIMLGAVTDITGATLLDAIAGVLGAAEVSAGAVALELAPLPGTTGSFSLPKSRSALAQATASSPAHGRHNSRV